MQKDVVLFLGAVVPDTSEYQTLAFRRSGNLAQQGIAESLVKKGKDVECVSLAPNPSYPRGPLWVRHRKETLPGKVPLVVPCFFNIMFVKSVMFGLYVLLYAFAWAWRNRSKRRVIMVYNTYTPPLFFVWVVSRLTGSKLVPILYDLGMPPKSLEFSLFKRMIYRAVELNAKIFIPKSDGRLIITEAMCFDYAQNKSCLLLDGGISESVLKRLSPIEHSHYSETGILRCVLAGSMVPHNGTRLIAEALKRYHNPSLEIVIAGYGEDRDYILDLCERDSRVSYVGELNHDELFALYDSADALMCLRVLLEEDKYVFPSKIFEFMVMGKLAITTPSSHIPEHYGDYCHVMKDDTADSLIDVWEKILRLDKESILLKGRISREYILKNKTWIAQAKSIISYLDTI